MHTPLAYSLIICWILCTVRVMPNRSPGTTCKTPLRPCPSAFMMGRAEEAGGRVTGVRLESMDLLGSSFFFFSLSLSLLSLHCVGQHACQAERYLLWVSSPASRCSFVSHLSPSLSSPRHLPAFIQL